MKKHFLALAFGFFLFSVFNSFSQVFDPVKWKFKSEKLKNKEIELVFEAIIEKNWYLYSQDIPEGGPIPTSFHFDNSDFFQLIGEVTEVTDPEVKYDPNFDLNVKLFSNKAIFKQKITAQTDESFVVKGFIEFMSCDNYRCLPPKEKDFEFILNKYSGSEETVLQSIDSKIEIMVGEPFPGEIGKKPLWGFFFISFLAGLAGILTPCVFPMIPITVTFFMKNSNNRARSVFQGLVYGISIMGIYIAIGLIISLTSAGADFANNLATHWIPNILFSLLFIMFAASFLGMFELVLPSRLVNRFDKQADKGGYLGTFFMAFTLVVVSFSCTGPIVGALLVEAAVGEVQKPLIGMFGFSLAFALPFSLFAIFPSWLSSLPKSGGWLNSVKVVLGFIVLAFSLKFLSVIDLTYHLGILGREIYLALWIVIFTLMGFYLLGKIKFAHDSDLAFIGVPRLFLTIITFAFVIYLIPGMFGAPLKIVSGLLPPQTTHSFNLASIIPDNQETKISFLGEKEQSVCETPKYSDFLHLPHNLKGYFDYEQGLACAKKLNKPIMLDFKGHACSKCAEMEAKVWFHPEVLKRLKNDYVIIALYVDDKTKLPEYEWITSEYDKKVKKTIGKKWADFQISTFNINTQPFYVIIDHNENTLGKPMGYDLDINKFIEFLNRGVKEFEKMKQL